MVSIDSERERFMKRCVSANIFCILGDTCYKNETERSKICFTHITQALQKRKEEWEVKAILRETRTPIIKLIYKRTGVHCDITVTSGLAVENSKLIRYCIAFHCSNVSIDE